MNILNGIVRIVSNKRVGTGFVVTHDGLIITCAHVLGTPRPEKAFVIFQGDNRQHESVSDKASCLKIDSNIVL